ncbi:hypothetical protein SNE40_012999 [Patella caerulea]|uniref:Uncharacterized protein n=1 Tax=Patella caerulea TaxID=87958 RepID=A0AAN8JNL8_PATCE
MFYEVKLPEQQQDYLRFYWWPDADLNTDPEIYKMTVHIFGAVSSPSCSNYALKRTAYDNQDKFSEVAVNTVLKDFYVDDCLKSVKTEFEAINLCRELRQLLSKGGFNLLKWISNSRELLNSLPVTE